MAPCDFVFFFNQKIVGGFVTSDKFKFKKHCEIVIRSLWSNLIKHHECGQGYGSEIVWKVKLQRKK